MPTPAFSLMLNCFTAKSCCGGSTRPRVGQEEAGGLRTGRQKTTQLEEHQVSNPAPVGEILIGILTSTMMAEVAGYT
jgi:hypothetical protein